MPHERRKTTRIRRPGRAGLVSLTDVDIGECTLRDISSTGARISVEDPEVVPDYFKLKVPGARELRRCRIRWRSGSDIGLEFFGPK
jgi:PilZ domain